MMSDSQLKQGPSAAAAGPSHTPVPATTHSHDTQFPRSPTQQLQFHTPVRQPIDPGPDTQFTPAPPLLSPYTDPHTVQVPIAPVPVTPSATLPMFQPAMLTTMAPALLPQTSMHRSPTVTLLPHSLPYPNFPEIQVTKHPPPNETASCLPLPNPGLSAKPVKHGQTWSPGRLWASSKTPHCR